jgi:hypothetical protein
MSAAITAPISDADRYQAVKAFDRRQFEKTFQFQKATAEERAALLRQWDRSYDNATDMMVREMAAA